MTERHLRLVPALPASDDRAWLSAWARSVLDAHTASGEIPSLADFHNGNQGAAAGSSVEDGRPRLQEEK